MVNVTSASKTHSNGYPKMAISTPTTNTITNEMMDHGHNLARKLRALIRRCARHHVNGLFILVAVTKASIDMKIGAKPPPTNHTMSERSRRSHAPYFLSMNQPAHMVTSKPKTIARMPVTKKLGITVKARSVPYSQNLYAGPIASIIMSLGATLP